MFIIMTQVPFLNVIGKSKVGKNMFHIFKLGAIESLVWVVTICEYLDYCSFAINYLKEDI